MSTELHPDAITENEQANFNYLIHGQNDGIANLALVRATFEGRNVAVIAHIDQVEDGSYRMWPMALLLDDELLARIVPPEGGMSTCSICGAGTGERCDAGLHG